jgi:hypothetical protein
MRGREKKSRIKEKAANVAAGVFVQQNLELVGNDTTYIAVCGKP